MPHCPNCQAEVYRQNSYCRGCGHDLSEPADADTTIETITTEESVSARTLDLHALKSRLQKMDDYEFEHFVADLWREMGWETEVSQASVDAGIDVIATQDTPYHQKKVIQAKRYGDSTTVGGPDIQQYASLKQQVQNADSVVIVTTSSFTSSAESRARELNVKLVDGRGLVEMIEDLDAYDIVDDYLNITKTTTKQVEVPADTPDKDTTTASPVEDTTTASPVQDEEPGAARRDRIQSEPSSKEAEDSPMDRFGYWHWVAAGTALLGYAVLNMDYSLYMAYLVGTILSIYMDMRHIRSRTTWTPRKWLYLGGMIFAMLPLPIYLINRYRFVSNN